MDRKVVDLSWEMIFGLYIISKKKTGSFFTCSTSWATDPKEPDEIRTRDQGINIAYIGCWTDPLFLM